MYYLSAKIALLVSVLFIYDILYAMESQTRARFDLSEKNLDDVFMLSFANITLKNNSHIQSLTFSNNNIGDTGLKALIDVLPSMRNINSIYIDTNNITNVGAATLATYLLSDAASNSKITYIDMRNNPITELGIQAIVDVWEEKQNCEILFPWKPLLKSHFESSPTYLTDMQKTVIRRLVKTGKRFCFDSQELDDDCAENIATYILYNNYKIKSLSCGSNNIGDKGIIAITNALPFAPNITHLFLANNHIGDRGFEVLLDYIVNQLSRIESVNVSRNPIWQKDDSALSYILRNKPNVQIHSSIKAKM
jgi:hypothetical protein